MSQYIESCIDKCRISKYNPLFDPQFNHLIVDSTADITLRSIMASHNINEGSI